MFQLTLHLSDLLFKMNQALSRVQGSDNGMRFINSSITFLCSLNEKKRLCNLFSRFLLCSLYAGHMLLLVAAISPLMSNGDRFYLPPLGRKYKNYGRMLRLGREPCIGIIYFHGSINSTDLRYLPNGQQSIYTASGAYSVSAP